MALPTVPLNIDPRGQAGSLVRGYNIPGVGGDPGFRNLLDQQMKIRQQMAEAELAMMQQQLQEARQRASHPYGPGSTYAQRMAAMDAPRLLGAQITGAEAEAQRAQREMGNLRNVIGESQTSSLPLSWGKYNRITTGRQFSGGPTGNASFQGPPIAAMGAGNQPSLARAMMAQRIASSAQGPGQYSFLTNPEPEHWQDKSGYAYGRGVASPWVTPAGMSVAGRAGVPTYNQQQLSPRTNFTNATLAGYANHRRGTLPGTLPEDQTAKVHRGEVIVSADQVDEPLMAYLIEDKRRKMAMGRMNGKGTGPGRKNQRSTSSYQMGSLSYPAGAMTPEQMIELMRGGGAMAPMAGEPPESMSPAPPGPSPALGLSGPFFGTPPGQYKAGPIGAAANWMLSPPSPETAARLRSFVPNDPRFAEAPPAEEAQTSSLPPEGITAEEPKPDLSQQMLQDALTQRTVLSKGTPQKFELGTQEYIDQQNAAMAANTHRQRAEQMQRWLSTALASGNADPETFKAMEQAISRHDKMADMIEQRQERAQERRLSVQQAAEDRVAEAYKTGVAAEVTADERAIRKRQQELRDTTTDYDRLLTKWASAEGKEKESYFNEMVNKYRTMNALQMNNLTREQAEVYLKYDLRLMTDEEFVNALDSLGRASAP